MNRYRLNLILGVLLFPLSDSGQGTKDVLLNCYEKYHAFMLECDSSLSNPAVKRQKGDQYKKAQKELIQYLTERNRTRIKSEDDILMLCENFFPMEQIERELTRIENIRRRCGYESVNLENISVFYLKIISRISHSLITYRDGTAAIRQWVNEGEENTDIFGAQDVFNKIEIWNLLSRFTTPDTYIAAAAVECGQGIEALFEQRSHIMLADKLLVKSLQKGYAENHLHFPVGFDYEISWLAYMELDFVEKAARLGKDTDACIRLELALFRCVASLYLQEKDRGQSFGRWLYRTEGVEIGELIMKLYRGEYRTAVEKECIKQIYQLYSRLKTSKNIYAYDYLLEGVYGEYVEYKTSSEFLFLYKGYQYICENELDGFFARLFLQYIRLKNEYFYKKWEQNVVQGLKYFQKRYAMTKAAANVGDLSAEDVALEVFRAQAKLPGLKKLEMRVAPHVQDMASAKTEYGQVRKTILPQLRDQMIKILSAYKRYILESLFGVREAYAIMQKQEKFPDCTSDIRQNVFNKIESSQPHIPTLGIVFHFLKREELEDASGNCCWRSMLDSSDRFFASRIYKRYFFLNVAIALEEMRDNIPKLNEYLVGIDAASDENAMEPWMFAATYKTMRSHEYAKPVLKTKSLKITLEKIQNIGFTYHVGEDFRHILSGLRHVDEVLENFNYKAGDRLGHALVMGMDVEQWVSDNEIVPIPLLEYMENLLWVWGLHVHEKVILDIPVEILEEKILDAAQSIYPNAEMITVKMLYLAYRKKFETDHKMILGRIKDENRDSSVTFCRLGKDINACYNMWTADKLLSTNYCPIFEERMNKRILLSVKRSEAALYQKLQEYLVNKVEQRGIYIETNPTSNLIIGDFSCIQKHPIFYLNQKYQGGEHRAFVTINSDDPAVFNTNVENELAYVYYAAESQGCAKSELLEWIDQIRQYGMAASFIQKEKSAELIYSEVEDMLYALKNWKIQ